MDTNVFNLQKYDSSLHHFMGQQSNEKVVYCFNVHWLIIMCRFFKFLLMTIMFIGGFYFFFWLYKIDIVEANIARWISLVIFIIYGYFFHYWIARIFDITMKIYIVTNMRIVIIDKSIFFKDYKDIIDLKKIQDISGQKQGLLSNILNYGDIEITLSSTSSKRIIENIPSPNDIVEIIDRAKRHTIQTSQTSQRVAQPELGLEQKSETTPPKTESTPPVKSPPIVESKKEAPKEPSNEVPSKEPPDHFTPPPRPVS